MKSFFDMSVCDIVLAWRRIFLSSGGVDYFFHGGRCGERLVISWDDEL